MPGSRVDGDSLGSDAACGAALLFLFSGFFIRFILPLVVGPVPLLHPVCSSPPIKRARFYLFKSDALSENPLLSEPAANMAECLKVNW